MLAVTELRDAGTQGLRPNAGDATIMSRTGALDDADWPSGDKSERFDQRSSEAALALWVRSGPMSRHLFDVNAKEYGNGLPNREASLRGRHRRTPPETPSF
jgi:hypothetical protein